MARLNDGWMLNAFGAGIDANAAWDARDLATRRGWPVRGQALYTVAALRQLIFHYQRLPHLESPSTARRWPGRPCWRR